MIRNRSKTSSGRRMMVLGLGLSLATILGIGGAIALNPAGKATESSAKDGGPPAMTAAVTPATTQTVQPISATPVRAGAGTAGVEPPRRQVRVVNVHGHDKDCAMIEVKRGVNGRDDSTRCLRKY